MITVVTTMMILMVWRCTAVYDGLAVDSVRQKLYYANAPETGGSVGELTTDGTGHRVLNSDVNSKPRALVLDNDSR